MGTNDDLQKAQKTIGEHANDVDKFISRFKFLVQNEIRYLIFAKKYNKKNTKRIFDYTMNGLEEMVNRYMEGCEQNIIKENDSFYSIFNPLSERLKKAKTTVPNGNVK